MTLARSLLCFALPAALALASGACSKPEPPTVRPISGKVSSISPAGITVNAKLEAYNPNDFELDVKSFTATVTLDQKYNVGTVTTPRPIKLPARKKHQFDLDIAMPWSDVGTLSPLALQNRDIPWLAEGKVKIGGDALDVDLPFKLEGVVTHKQVVDAVGKSIPKIPGLPF